MLMKPLRYNNPADYEADLKDGKFKRAIFAYGWDPKKGGRCDNPDYAKATYEVQCVMLPLRHDYAAGMNMRDIVPGWKSEPICVMDLRRETRWWVRLWNRLTWRVI